jgi:hypothetical protein
MPRLEAAQIAAICIPAWANVATAPKIGGIETQAGNHRESMART